MLRVTYHWLGMGYTKVNRFTATALNHQMPQTELSKLRNGNVVLRRRGFLLEGNESCGFSDQLISNEQIRLMASFQTPKFLIQLFQ